MAAKLEGLTSSKYKLKQKINLREILGFSPSETQKEQIGQAIIDRIIDRTESNKSVNGTGFKKYSKQYINSEEFELYGKNPGDINLTLKGDMLNSIDIIDSTRDTITIGFDDPTEEKKAANHQKGVTVPSRPFFGVTKSDINTIKKDFINEEEVQEEERQTLASFFATSEADQQALVALITSLFETPGGE